PAFGPSGSGTSLCIASSQQERPQSTDRRPRRIPDVPAWPTARIAAYAPGQNRPYLLDCSFDLALRLRYALGGERRASTNEGAVEHRSAAAGSAEATTGRFFAFPSCARPARRRRAFPTNSRRRALRASI